MNSPAPRRRLSPASFTEADEQQLRQWLRLRRELTELHARLEYLKLLMKLGVAR